jgi:hypothetical protein
VRELRLRFPDATTHRQLFGPIRQSHDGALYRACNWWWAPTWHRLQAAAEQATAQWTEGEHESVKDRWVFALQATILGGSNCWSRRTTQS